MPSSAYECARDLLDVVPLVMRAIRQEIRDRRSAELTVPQFRTLVFLDRRPGASLATLAEHLGLTPPSTCKLVDGLAQRNLINRQTSVSDRRRVALELTPDGESILGAARKGTAARLAEILSGLSPTDLATISRSMSLLRPLFSPGETPLPDHERNE